ncbi:MAG: Crp/Fnr family transcriptional regulator [Pseudoflavonifractor capillosus]|nr:Crp/Fnr family transcriptional regulator [Pseudoflavonifractor capillosus]MCI5927101.1 Crp/Fnr family transcriptional regulator [Pseudoflavonifractor capillosus]MDY4661885.1 Crp/Fnr family transcriptional regulator [Pseudoflavonifractor capillosus]
MTLDNLCARYPALTAQFKELPARLLEISDPVQLYPGQKVVVRDEPVEYAYYILSGELLVCNETMEGKFSTWMTMQAPTVISDLEILAGIGTYAASVSAAARCVALRSPAEEFTALLRSDVDFLWSVAAMVTQKNFALSHTRGNAAFRSSLDKTALFLLQHCVLSPPGDGESVVLKTRSRIASEVIISQKTLDRCLMRLRDDGYLSIVRGKVRISASQHQRLLDTWGPTC